MKLQPEESRRGGGGGSNRGRMEAGECRKSRGPEVVFRGWWWLLEELIKKCVHAICCACVSGASLCDTFAKNVGVTNNYREW